MPASTHETLRAAYRSEARRVLAALIKLLGDFDEAEEALHDAFVAAAEQWPRDGMPANPYAWLVSAGRFKTIDRWRRQARLRRLLPDLVLQVDEGAMPSLPEAIPDDELRLIFMCCHPALAPDASAALTLREVGGLTTEAIARAYLAPIPTIAQRIVRAKARLREDRVGFDLPGRAELPARLDRVLKVIYLIFNEGHAAALDDRDPTRGDLCAEAIRLGRLLVDLQHGDETCGLLALMLLHEARRSTRRNAHGEVVLLEDQDRSRWDRRLIAEAMALLDGVQASGRAGPYALQAAIVATHSCAASVPQTDWSRIVMLYALLWTAEPTPVVALNGAVASGMRDGPEAGLAAIEQVLARGGLERYPMAFAARADFQRRLGQNDAARTSYEHALALTHQPRDRRFLQRRLDQLAAAA